MDDSPIEEPQGKSSKPEPPAVEALLAYARLRVFGSVTGMEFGGLRLEALPRGCAAARGFRVGVNRHRDADRCWVDFDPHRFDPADVAAFAGRLRAFLAAVATKPSRPVRGLHESLASSKPATAPG
jgi:hypothetical protein